MFWLVIAPVTAGVPAVGSITLGWVNEITPLSLLTVKTLLSLTIFGPLTDIPIATLFPFSGVARVISFPDPVADAVNVAPNATWPE